MKIYAILNLTIMLLFITACDSGNSEGTDSLPPVVSAIYCDGPTVGTSCTSSIVKVADFSDVQCVDFAGDPNCPANGQVYFGQDANTTIDPESYTIDTVGGDKMTEAVTGLSWAKSAYVANSLMDAISQCDILASGNYAGITDWHVPTIRELSRIISKDASGGVWPNYLDNPFNSFWWTTTPVKNDPSMSIGMSGNWPWTYTEPVDGVGGVFSGARFTFCVSGPAMAGAWEVIQSQLIVNHTVTGLMWQRSPSMGQFNWDDGLKYCEASSVGGFTDWRLPSLREYISVLDFNSGTDYMSAAFDGVLDATMLTSTPNRIGATYTELAHVNESTGVIRQQNVNTLMGYVRCVRGPI